LSGEAGSTSEGNGFATESGPECKLDKKLLAIYDLICIMPHDCSLTSWQDVVGIHLRLSPFTCHVHRSLTHLAFSFHSEIASAPMVGERCGYAGHILCWRRLFCHRHQDIPAAHTPTEPISVPERVFPGRKPKEQNVFFTF